MAEEQIASKEVLFQEWYGFLQLLKEMEDKGEKEKTVFGILEGPFFSKAVYSCVIRLGLENEFR